jgi:excisionase family DNA binding protein
MAGEPEIRGQFGGGSAGGGADSSLPEPERLLTPAEVASMFRVDPKTVTRWARDGRLTAVRTLGGHRRYLESEVLALLRAARATDAE